MLTYNDQTKARFPLSLDGRGARGEGVLAALLLGCAALLAAPQAAFADNECTPVGIDPSANAALPDDYTCDDPIGYTSGVTYDSDGNLSVESTVDNNEFGGNGIQLTGNGADGVSFLADGVEIEGRDLVGALLDVETDAGDINITTEAVDADAHNGAGVIHGIRAISTGGGDVSITTTGTVAATSGVTTGAIGMEARSLAGDVDIATEGTVSGEAYGIVVEAAGVAMVIDGNVQADNNNGIAALDVTAGAGGLDLTIDGNIQGGMASDGWAIRAVSTGGAVIDVLGGQFGNTGSGGAAGGSAVDFSGVTGGGVTMTFAGASATSGHWEAYGDSIFSDEADTLTFGGVGINSLAYPGSIGNGFHDLTDEGSIDFGAGDDVFIVKDAAIFNIGTTANVQSGSATPVINPGASIDFGDGDDLFRLSSTAEQMWQENTFIDFGPGDDTLDNASRLQLGGLTTNLGAEIDFGSGADTFNNSGIFSPSGPVVLSGLETFNNAGVILLGTNSIQNDSRPDFTASNSDPDDVLTMAGAAFTGSGDSRIIADVLLDTNTQVDCSAPTGAGDCIYMPGGTTAGVTQVTINNASDVGILGAHNPVGVTVVDVDDGTSAADHFVLDPDSTDYVDDAVYGPAIETLGLFRYVLQYDADNQRHVMAGLPRSEVFEYAALGSAVHSIWHMTSEAITDRRNDLRADQEGAVWLRGTTDHARRDLTNSTENYGQTYTMDHGYRLDAEALIGGIDMVSGHNGTVDYVAGVQLGYTRSQMVLETGTSAKLSGAVVGAYGSLWSDQFFIDGTVNTNFLALNNNSPLGKTNTRLESLGVHVEAGLRIGLPENFYAEPLTTLSYVNTVFEEISVDGGEILPDDAKSTRSAFGLRLGREWSGDTLNGSYFVTGRAWNVHEGGGDGIVNNPGIGVQYSDDFSGSFTQVEVGLSLHNKADTVSGYVSADSKSKDDYRSNNLSAGVRLRW